MAEQVLGEHDMNALPNEVMKKVNEIPHKASNEKENRPNASPRATKKQKLTEDTAGLDELPGEQINAKINEIRKLTISSIKKVGESCSPYIYHQPSNLYIGNDLGHHRSNKPKTVVTIGIPSR
jgi:hypothetical protein